MTTEKELKELKVIQVKPEAGPVDLSERVKVKLTGSPFHLPPTHKDGDVVECSPYVAKKMEKNGWGKIITLIAFLFFAVGAQAQSTSFQKLAKVVSALPATANKLIFSDTVTNTGTNFLTTGYPQTGTTYAGSAVAIVNPAYSTNVQVNITKISGTVAGTVTLQGSLDGVKYSTVISPEYATSFAATATATDVASQTFNWTLAYNPYRFYRVTWTGAGTMAASMTAFIWTH